MSFIIDEIFNFHFLPVKIVVSGDCRLLMSSSIEKLPGVSPTGSFYYEMLMEDENEMHPGIDKVAATPERIDEEVQKTKLNRRYKKKKNLIKF